MSIKGSLTMFGFNSQFRIAIDFEAIWKDMKSNWVFKIWGFNEAHCKSANYTKFVQFVRKWPCAFKSSTMTNCTCKAPMQFSNIKFRGIRRQYGRWRRSEWGWDKVIGLHTKEYKDMQFCDQQHKFFDTFHNHMYSL